LWEFCFKYGLAVRRFEVRSKELQNFLREYLSSQGSPVPSSARAMNWSKDDLVMKDQPSVHPVQFEKIKQNGSPIERKVSIYIYNDKIFVI
jgi:hypothetical protein